MNVLLKDIFYEKSTVQYQVSRRPRCPPLSASPLTRPWRYTTYGLCIQHNRVSSIPYGYRTRGSPSFGCLVYIGLRNIILPFRKQVGYSNITNHNTRILQPHGWCFLNTFCTHVYGWIMNEDTAVMMLLNPPLVIMATNLNHIIVINR